MKRPKKYQAGQILISEYDRTVYLATDIDPLLDRLEQLESAREFPSFEEYRKRFPEYYLYANDVIYNWFARFKPRTVYPKVGDMVEGDGITTGVTERGKITMFNIERKNGTGVSVTNIRPITTPTRADVIEKARKLGLTDDEIKLLKETKCK